MNFPLTTFMNFSISCGLIGLGVEQGAELYYKWYEEDSTSLSNDRLIKKVQKIINAALVLQTMPIFWVAAAAGTISSILGGSVFVGTLLLAATHLELTYSSQTNNYTKPILYGTRQITQSMNAAVVAAKVATVAPLAFAVLAYLGVAVLSTPFTVTLITITFF